jgi:CheY-like chemotaxis protein
MRVRNPVRKRALVLDDSATARVILKRMLESHGLAVDTAVSAEDAFEQLKTSHPDVIFMDHLMPGMDGLEALRVIKDDPATAMIPIMMYTSKGGSVYVSEARALGAVGVLSKEVKPVELLNVLQSLHLVPEEGGKESPQDRQPAPDTQTPEPRKSKPAAPKSSPSAPPHPEPAAPAVPSDTTPVPATVQIDPAAVREAVEPLLTTLRVRLRNEIGRMAQQVAKEAAGEAVRRQAAVMEAVQEPGEPDRRTTWALGLAGAALALALVGLGYLLAMRQEPVAAQQSADPPALAAATPFGAAGPRAGDAANPIAREIVGGTGAPNASASRDVPDALLEAVAWLYDTNASVPYDQPLLGPHTLKLLQGTVRRLAEAGFRGTLEVHTHAARFCLQRTASDRLVLPPETTPLEACEMVLRSDTEQSLGFAEFLVTEPALVSGQIRVRLVHHGLDAPRVEVPLGAGSGMRAGEWNRIARQNYRTTLRILRES